MSDPIVSGGGAARGPDDAWFVIARMPGRVTGYPATSTFNPVSQDLWIDVNTGAIISIANPFTFTTPIVTDSAGAGSLTARSRAGHLPGF